MQHTVVRGGLSGGRLLARLPSISTGSAQFSAALLQYLINCSNRYHFRCLPWAAISILDALFCAKIIHVLGSTSLG